MFILSQILGTIALIIAIISVQFKEKTKLLFMQSIENIIKISALALVGGFSGAFSETVGLFRKIWFFKNSRDHKINKINSLIFFCTLAIVVGVIFWEGPITLLPITGVILRTIGLWQDNIFTLRYFTLLGCINYGIYSVLVGAYTNAVSEAFVIIFIIISIIRLNKKEEEEKESLKNTILQTK